MDGAKAFGHNAILVVNKDGTSDFFSYMGTGKLGDTVRGKESLAYMGHVEMKVDETEEFLNTGDIKVPVPGGGENPDNYDRALRKTITETEYNQIMSASENYVNLYDNANEANIDIEEYLENNKDAAYNFYNHNCDTVTGEILGLIDDRFVSCHDGILYTTPNNSYYVRKVLLSEEWEEINMGKNNIFEKTIGTEGLYYFLHANINNLLGSCD